MRKKVGKLIEVLKKVLSDECQFVYYPRRMEILYRGVRVINPVIQQKQIRLQITHRGWVPGMLIDPDTDLNSDEFVSKVLERFEKSKKDIDSKMGT